MDYLFINLILWGKEQGFKSFNLGMAPSPVWKIDPSHRSGTELVPYSSSMANISIILMVCVTIKKNTTRFGSPAIWPAREVLPCRRFLSI